MRSSRGEEPEREQARKGTSQEGNKPGREQVRKGTSQEGKGSMVMKTEFGLAMVDRENIYCTLDV